MSFLVRAVCIIAPPSLFALLWLFSIVMSVETWKCAIASGVVFVWTIAVGCRMRGAWRSEICGRYKGCLVTSLVEHALVIGFASLMLDFGITLYACILGGVLYWMIVGLILANRPLTPTRWDLLLVTHGFFMMGFAIAIIYGATIMVRGY